MRPQHTPAAVPARARAGQRPDVPGSLAHITATVAEAGANIDEVHHQRAFTMLAAQNVDVELVLQTRGREHLAAVLAALTAAGFEAVEQRRERVSQPFGNFCFASP